MDTMYRAMSRPDPAGAAGSIAEAIATSPPRGSIPTNVPPSRTETRLTANDGPAGPIAVPNVHLQTIVDLLAEAFIATIAANDNCAPLGE